MIENILADFVLKHSFESITDENIHVIKRNILDSYAGICASLSDLDMLRKFDRLTKMTADPNGIIVWGTGGKAKPVNALFMNCIMGRRSDLVNTYLSPNNMGGSHPSDNVSLVLSLAVHMEKYGKDMLSATYLAYQLSCAFADFYDPQASLFDHDAQALMYIPLVIGYMQGLSLSELIESQRIAGMLGLTTDQSSFGEVTDWRHCTYASAAMRAMEAVHLSRAGFSGATNIYEGKAGISHFFQHSQSIMNPMPELGSVIFKRWPALVFCQTPIDVSIEAGKQLNEDDFIEKIEIFTSKKAMDVGAIPASYKPISRAGRTHSIPYCVAVAINKKTIKYEYFDDTFIKQEHTISSLIPKINVIEDPEMTAKFPKGAPCKIIIHLSDKDPIEVEREYPKGDPQDPLSDQEVTQKAFEYISDIAGDNTNRIIERIWNIEKEKKLDWMLAPLIKRKI